jgi:hypothetical protein
VAPEIPKGTPAELAKYARSLVQKDISVLAPQMQTSILECNSALVALGIDVTVYEAMRSDELAVIYNALGVSRAKDASHTWHHWGLAVDVISKSRGWDVYPTRHSDGTLHGGDPKWYEPVWRAYDAAGLTLGKNFRSIFDAPHVQWGGCPASPTADLIEIGNTSLLALWKAVGAC